MMSVGDPCRLPPLAPWVSPPELTRARRYARRDPDQWPWLLAARAEVFYGRMLAGPLRRLLSEPGVRLGGISAAAERGMDVMVTEGEAELYVTSSVLARLRQENRIQLDPEVANVVLRVPRVPMDMLAIDGGSMPSAVIGADLLDSDEPRTARVAHELLRADRANA